MSDLQSQLVPAIPLDAQLKMAGIGYGYPQRRQGVVLDFNHGPHNRAQRRMLARLKRRAAKR